jgi:cupin fold WbuC family metalloprotein
MSKCKTRKAEDKADRGLTFELHMIKITETLINDTLKKAKTLPRKRLNYNFHKTPSDPINRMINAVERGAYFPPHKHVSPDKREVFIILKGKVLVAEFHPDGRVKDHFILDPEKGDYGVEIEAGEWHSLIPFESSVLYEIKDGPYSKETDKTFADWAPGEDEKRGSQKFVEKVLKECGV